MNLNYLFIVKKSENYGLFFFGAIMIGIILAAGTGTRLRPLTENIPKTLLRINDMTILERLLRTFVSNNVNEFIVVAGHFREKVEKCSLLLEDKYNVKIKIIENKKYDITNTSCSTYLASREINDDFILVNGDNVLDPEIIKRIVESKYSSVIIDNYKELNNESFKIRINNGVIEAIGKDLDVSKSSGEFIGVSKVIKKDLENFNEILLNLIKNDPQNYYDFTYKSLSKKSKMEFVFTNGLEWTEIDDHYDWKEAQKLIKKFDKA